MASIGLAARFETLQAIRIHNADIKVDLKAPLRFTIQPEITTYGCGKSHYSLSVRHEDPSAQWMSENEIGTRKEHAELAKTSIENSLHRSISAILEARTKAAHEKVDTYTKNALQSDIACFNQCIETLAPVINYHFDKSPPRGKGYSVPPPSTLFSFATPIFASSSKSCPDVSTVRALQSAFHSLFASHTTAKHSEDTEDLETDQSKLKKCWEQAESFGAEKLMEEFSQRRGSENDPTLDAVKSIKARLPTNLIGPLLG